jgi:hypothetical protein
VSIREWHRKPSGQTFSKGKKGNAIGMPSGSRPLFQLGISPSSDSEDSEGLQGAPAISERPIAFQSRTGLLSRRAQPPPTSKKAISSPLLGDASSHPQRPGLSLLKKFSTTNQPFVEASHYALEVHLGSK